MKRLLIIALFATVALLIVRTRLPKVQKSMEAHCKAMFEKMSNPPKTTTVDDVKEISTTEGVGESSSSLEGACCS